MKKGGLTFEQERAAQLIALGKRISDKEICESVGVAASTLTSWRSNIRFKLRVMQLFEDNVEVDRVRRSNRVRKYLKPIYKEILKKMKNKKNLETLPLRELMRLMAQLHNELRLDFHLAKKTVKTNEEVEDVILNNDVDEEEYDENALMLARGKYVKNRKAVDEEQKTLRLVKSGSDS